MTRLPVIRLAGLALIFLLVVFTRMHTSAPAEQEPGADATMALGFVLVVAFLIGRFLKRHGIPSITGYILTGVLFGPYVLAAIAKPLTILSHETVAGLQLLDGAALGLIALTAGGELKLSMLRGRRRSIAWVIVCHAVIVTLGVALSVYAAHGYIEGLKELSAREAWMVALLFGVSALAKSPATTIAIIQEYQPRGPMTDLVLAVTVTKDVVVITLFTVALALAVPLAAADVVGPAHRMEGAALGLALLRLGWEVFGSLLLGLLSGWLLTFYVERGGGEMPLVVLAVAFLSGALSTDAHLSGLLICMVAGFYVENFSEHGEDLIEAIERHSLPLYVIFFTIAGAAIELPALVTMWPLALGLVVARLLFTFSATFLGARLGGEPQSVQRYAWTGFIDQAGVTLGFAAMIARRLPGYGVLIRTIIVTAVAMNLCCGPIVFRWGLRWAGEISAEDDDRDQDTLMRS